MTEQTIPSSIATELGVVGIAGTGLLGASIGLRLREHGVRVIGFDVDASSSDTALRRGAIDDIAERFSALANSVDTLILATPIDVVCLQLNELTQSSAFSDGGIGASNGTFAKIFRLITDVASVKSSVERASRGLSSFIGSHPIAGSERSGPDAAQSDIFVGKPWAYCVPPGADDERAHTALLTLIACLGGKPQAISAAEHDAIVALSSHLPQYLSSALGSLVGEHDLHGLNGTGLASMLRLARSNWPMWRGIFVENGPHIAATLRIFAERALADAEALETGNTGALGGRFAEGSAASFALCPDLAPRETAPKR